MTINPQATQVVLDNLPTQLANSNTNNNNKRRRRPHNKSISDASSTASTDTKHSNDSNNNARRRRRRRAANKKSQEQQQQQQPAPELSAEEKARYVALDAEMVGVGPGGYQSICARVTCVGWEGNTLLDIYVQPNQTVTDYRTFVSGITAEDLESDDAVSMDECRAMVHDLLEDKILVGHALKNDLYVLDIEHPWYNTRDTGKYEPFMKVRFEDGVLWPRKLKELAKNKLSRDIQIEGTSHSSYEDALAALDLYKKARGKWEKAMNYKINKTKSIMAGQQELAQ